MLGELFADAGTGDLGTSLSGGGEGRAESSLRFGARSLVEQGRLCRCDVGQQIAFLDEVAGLEREAREASFEFMAVSFSHSRALSTPIRSRRSRLRRTQSALAAEAKSTTAMASR